MRMQKTVPARAYPSASQNPPKTNQMMLSRVRTGFLAAVDEPNSAAHGRDP